MEALLTVVLAHADTQVREQLTNILTSFGHKLHAVCETTSELLAACYPKPPQMIVTGIMLKDGHSIDTLLSISEIEPTPAVVVTDRDSLADAEQALKDHVMAYLVEPVTEEDIKPTIFLARQRFRQFEELRAENKDLRQALADRKVVERAKGILMASQNLSEDEAYRSLQKLAQSKRKRLVEVADAILTAAELDAV
ncbi:ANTAR domain-containing response regulator [Aeoliella mucimassa]|uniref:Putative transcriptional regulatory protein pdtaR n=1 Tax=Aeoliella mucimassa TaxID=2527972 RepID=A0A518AI26_9BACT|nr:ANTAR domain-containing protein [Aeoliella mucimassa]QDU54382.1 putative transcriptional regulatory protein pdtaR [Aeoliella mucimassa]